MLLLLTTLIGQLSLGSCHWSATLLKELNNYSGVIPLGPWARPGETSWERKGISTPQFPWPLHGVRATLPNWSIALVSQAAAGVGWESTPTPTFSVQVQGARDTLPNHSQSGLLGSSKHW